MSELDKWIAEQMKTTEAEMNKLRAESKRIKGNAVKQTQYTYEQIMAEGDAIYDRLFGDAVPRKTEERGEKRNGTF